MNILDYIEDCMAQGMPEEDANRCADAEFNLGPTEQDDINRMIGLINRQLAEDWAAEKEDWAAEKD